MKPTFPAIDGAPLADKRSATATFHGVTLCDDYAWLRAENWQEAMREPDKLPEDIKAYLQAENAYYDAAMADTATLQETLIAEMRGRIKEDDSSVPRKHGPYAYQWRYAEGAEHPVYLRTPRDGGDETVLFDANAEAATHDYFEYGDIEVSPGHSLMTWAADTNGSEFYSLHIRDLATGQDSDYQIADVGSVAWADNTTLFYSKVDENHRPTKVFRHVLGTDPASDVLVYEEKDPRYGLGVGRSRSGAFIGIYTGMNDENEVWIIPTETPEAAPKLIEPRSAGIQYSLEEQGDHFLIRTNADDAVDFKIVKAPIASPSRENWVDVLPHEPGRMIVSMSAHKDWMIWVERANALPRICYLAKGQPVTSHQVISFDEEAYALGADPSPEYDTNAFRFTYSSPTTPGQVFDFDLETGVRTLRKTTEIPSGHDPADYVTRRIMAPSHDGAAVPVTILHHKDTAIDGSAPCLLYGYGSYGMSMPASFSANRLSLVDRGFVYAIAHIRGGEEKGRAWYEDAKFGKKVNSFHDFIAAAEALIAAHYTSKGQIVIQGGSAGGLLVGSVVNMRPDLLAGMIGDVPFVDVLNTILDDTLPLTPGEWSQWGNPIESKDAFADIKGYSPYDNVTAQDYPAMLVTAGVSDPRVTYWEPAKWVAKLRVTKTDDNILLLRTNMTSGHFGKSGRFAALEDAARSYAFALKAVGKA
ncbi:S9 family peptidase [Yoonia sediminilitoris]|uniref:Oligopeptidase B n=1 Tax=Yoonia sediminilitoris TaxID=1286148 RepID=A0A2T6KFX9_9RHOB|nr:S9 family peptidase [Yoonia sediminilitoris]PUB14229.1 oligopeptidase B [Yoonia sediminilitoris]RCW95160.1 oligopeptidase B [Yoonia sediminilitoris]